jgi:hypothetical protein
MSYRALEGYFAPAREAWLAEQRAMEAEAQARGVTQLQWRPPGAVYAMLGGHESIRF